MTTAGNDVSQCTGCACRPAEARLRPVFLDGEEALDAYMKAPEVRWVDVAGIVEAPPPADEKKLPGKSRDSMQILSGGFKGLTGKGVVIVVIDSGIDFRHPDFITAGEGGPTSRLLYLWDTVKPPESGSPGGNAPLAYPNGVSIGTLYAQSELTAELRNPTGKIPRTDENGHGTACAGIAAGNGSVSKECIGVAPQAELVGVRIGPGPNLPGVYLLNAICAWADEQFKGRPVIISCSFADLRSGHDGQRISERQLSERFGADRPGRIICVAAGNEGADRISDLTRFKGAASPGSFVWQSKSGGHIAIYADGFAPNELELVFKKGPSLEVSSFQHPLSGSTVFEFDVPKGEGRVALYSKNGAAGSADAYVVAARGGTVFTGNVKAAPQIGTPGAAVNVLTVGSYDFNEDFNSVEGRVRLGDQRTGQELQLGKISDYSNSGPLRHSKIIKPDIIAPGQYFTAPAATGVRVRFPDASGKYRLFNGTSAATPYMAGMLALMMEKKPDLTLAEVRRFFQEDKKLRNGVNPDGVYGYGRLDFFGAERLIKRVME